MLHGNCLTELWIWADSEYTRDLNMAGFWMYYGSEYASTIYTTIRLIVYKLELLAICLLNLINIF